MVPRKGVDCVADALDGNETLPADEPGDEAGCKAHAPHGPPLGMAPTLPTALKAMPPDAQAPFGGDDEPLAPGAIAECVELLPPPPPGATAMLR